MEAENIIILPPVAEKSDHGGRKPPPKARQGACSHVNNIF